MNAPPIEPACATCANCIKINKHPHNKVGKGSIGETFGYLCNLDQPFVFMDSQMGCCEMYTKQVYEDGGRLNIIRWVNKRLELIGRPLDSTQIGLIEFAIINTMNQSQDVKERAIRFAYECRLRGINTNSDTVDLYEKIYPNFDPNFKPLK